MISVPMKFSEGTVYITSIIPDTMANNELRIPMTQAIFISLKHLILLTRALNFRS